MENCIALINDNGGFTVTGWYKRGSINDKGLIAPPSSSNSNNTNNGSNSNHNHNAPEVVQVDSSAISYHVVSIIPHDRDFLDSTTELGRELNALQVDAVNIERFDGE